MSGCSLTQRPEFAALFEKIEELCAEEMKNMELARMMFCMGQLDLIQATARGFLTG